MYLKGEYGNKRRIFLQISNDTLPVVRATMAAVGISLHGLYRAMSKSASEFLVAHVTSKCVRTVFVSMSTGIVQINLPKSTYSFVEEAAWGP